MNQGYDIVVVGGGHAGIEAAWAASRLGASTALITMDRRAIGRMSCNPAIGGIGKGHMVREIDALGGLMGLATDRAGIQFRMLNRSKGPAVWAPRAQCDRDAYAAATQALLADADHLDIVEGVVDDLLTTEFDGFPRITGVRLADGRQLRANAVILTTGTFLRGLMHCGSRRTEGGRIGEAPAVGVSRALERLGFQLGRLKTGTPPRLHRDTLDYDRLEPQPGDDPPSPFSFMTDALPQRQVSCWITYTNPDVHDLIRDNLHLAPMYSGQIESRGPRYCPSIEDKVVRFAEKDRHQLFLEPEGYDNERIYCNGISTSLPAEVQDRMIRHVPGLENAKILQHGYAVEYDWVPSHQTTFSLETKRVRGLYLAGQINGTSGYEEAAGQGILAGLNAARAVGGLGPIVLGRDQAYLGVMIDDLLTKPQHEPYRMFTSRAEHRLRLRSDNSDERLTPLGREIGLVDDARWRRFQTRRSAIDDVTALVRSLRVDGAPLAHWLRRPDATVEAFAGLLAHGLSRAANDNAPHGSSAPAPLTFDRAALQEVLTRARYEGYLDRQTRHIERMRKLEHLRLPETLDYAAVGHLKVEARENLARVRPATLGQASRIPGITAADLTVLWLFVTRRRGGSDAGSPQTRSP
ncbi:MAG: tRNA uridine 5-carboxymethylaminomethyl modification enzyme MnmG [Planctomycetota bacterium]|nr:MAG: tRNA uridine 5-carboxymethylaminomethyl modification enzyme MnmG [Planctomycetota bacterium]